MADDYQYMAQPQNSQSGASTGSQGGNNQGGNNQGGNNQGAIFGMQPFDYWPRVHATTNYGFPSLQQRMQWSSNFFNPFGPGGPLDQSTIGILSPDSFMIKNAPISRYLENYGFPAAQLQQNAYQYQNDFNEAQRRWLADFEWRRQGDQFNMSLASAQFNAGLAQAQQQQQNFAQQFAHQQYLDALAQGNWEKAHALNQLIQQQNYELGMMGANTAQYRADTERQLGMGSLDLQRQGQLNEMTRFYEQMGFSREQAAQQAQQWQREYELQRQLGLGQLGVSQAAQQAQAAYWQGQLDLGQQQLALQQQIANAGTWEQRQAAQRALEQLQLQRQIATQGDWGTQQQVALQRAQLEQDLMLQRERMAAEREMSAMQAFGRAQAPTARYVQGWV